MKKMKKIVLSAGAIGTIVVPITAFIACGDDKTDFDFTTDLEKVEDTLTSSKLKASLKTDIGTKEAETVVTAAELGITDAGLSEGVSVTYAVKTKYTDAGVVVVTATLTKDGKTSTKEITINGKTYDFTTDLTKVIATLTSSKKKSALKASVGIINLSATVTAAQLGITDPKLSEGVSIAYVVKAKDTDAGIIVATATLTKGEDTATKDITITANIYDFAGELTKVADSISTKKLKILNRDVRHKAAGDAINDSELGITTVALGGVTVAYVVKTIFDITNGGIVVTATLTKGEDTATKDITITAAENTEILSAHLAKAIDAISSKKGKALKADIGQTRGGRSVTFSALGIDDVSDSTAGIEAAYTVKIPFDIATGLVVVRVTLTTTNEKAVKDITITAKANTLILPTDLTKIIDATSTKNKAALNTDIGSKEPGETTNDEELGITTPITLMTDSIITTYTIKTKYNNTTGTVVVTALLTKNDEIAEKDITITASLN